MKSIVDYMQQTREERRKHLLLEQSCSEIGGNSSIEFKGLLAYFLGTEIPTRQGHRIMLCHACGNAKCSNVNHLYWGTAKDNHLDGVEHGTILGSIYATTEKKHGKQFIIDNARRAARISAEKRTGKQKGFEEFREKLQQYHPFEWGWQQRASADLGISHTQIRRICQRLKIQTSA